MSNTYATVRRHPLRTVGMALFALMIAATTFFVARMDTRAAPPSSFMEQGPVAGTQDGNIKYDGQAGSFDWGNPGACTTTAGTVSCAGTGGLFNGGHANGNNTPPTAPTPTAAGTVGTNFIDAIGFGVDPLVTDSGSCSPSPGGSQVPPCTPPQATCGTGDPTVYTGAGGEKNGDALIGKGVETYSLASVPPKDDVQNIYAVSRSGFGATNDGKEVFFGGERNFTSGQGDSHFDFEFLQASVTLVLARRRTRARAAGASTGTGRRATSSPRSTTRRADRWAASSCTSGTATATRRTRRRAHSWRTARSATWRALALRRRPA
jgi:hypothetical protein